MGRIIPLPTTRLAVDARGEALTPWPRTATHLRGVAWLLASGATLAAMSVVIRICAKELHPFVIVFFRNIFSLLLMSAWLYGSGFKAMRTKRIGFYTLRAGISLLSILAWFYGVTVMPLGTATAINFTTPLFATVGAILLLGERAGSQRWLALLGGLAGVVVVIRPDDGLLHGDAWIILLSAAASGMSIVTIKFLSRTESPAVIVAYFTLFLTPLSLIPAVFVWSWPSLALLPWLFLLAVMATLAHLFATKAYALADASYLAPFEFGRLVFAVALGYVFFAERTDTPTWLGAAMIAAAAAYALRPERPAASIHNLST